MTPTEISEHVQSAVQAWYSGENMLVEHAILHGIQLAVESKDKRIAELEAELDQCHAVINDESKGREIERLNVELGNSRDSESKLIRDRYAVSEAYNQAVAQLTEANAKLAEAEAENNAIRASMPASQELVETLTTQLSSAQAEIDRLSSAMEDAFREGYGYGKSDEANCPESWLLQAWNESDSKKALTPTK